MTEEKYVSIGSVKFGADPEFFFRDKKTKKVIGSEKVIDRALGFESGEVIRDGVQGEINLKPSTCREIFGGKLLSVIRDLNHWLEKNRPDVIADFYTPNVKVTKKEMESLSMDSQQFGCAPSFNAYKRGQQRIDKDGMEYRWRSAGGHIHIGARKRATVSTIKVADLLVGIPSIILDKAKNNKERRTTYGKAGEYRKTTYGFEYRTLSNFWLMDYRMISMVMGFMRTAVAIGSEKWARDKLLSLFDSDEVQRVINENDEERAREMFKVIHKEVCDMIKPRNRNSPYSPLFYKRLKKFMSYKDPMGKFGLRHKDMSSYTSKHYGVGSIGAEKFLCSMPVRAENKLIVGQKVRIKRDLDKLDWSDIGLASEMKRLEGRVYSITSIESPITPPVTYRLSNRSWIWLEEALEPVN